MSKINRGAVCFKFVVLHVIEITSKVWIAMEQQREIRMVMHTILFKQLFIILNARITYWISIMAGHSHQQSHTLGQNWNHRLEAGSTSHKELLCPRTLFCRHG